MYFIYEIYYLGISVCHQTGRKSSQGRQIYPHNLRLTHLCVIIILVMVSRDVEYILIELS